MQCEAGEMLDVKTLRIQEIRYYGATGVECDDASGTRNASDSTKLFVNETM